MSTIRAYKPSLSRETWKNRHLYLLMAPFLLVFMVFIIIPIVVSVVLSFTDYLARFIIDYVTGSILGSEALAVIWLLLQFLYEGVFIVMSMLLILLQAGKYRSAETARSRTRHSPAAAVRCSVLLTLLSRLILEAVSIVQFVTTYTGITSAETASMIGSVIRILVIYGGGALILGEFFTDFLRVSPQSAEEV